MLLPHLALVAGLLVPFLLAAETVLQVETGGRGRFPSVQAALDHRSTLGPGTVRIVLAPGRHELASPLRIGAEHSGTVIEGDVQGSARISGGFRLKDWTRSPEQNGVWQTVVPNEKGGRPFFRQLFVDGRRAQRARSPNVGYFQTTARMTGSNGVHLPFRKGDLRPEWANSGAELVVLMKWTDLHVPLRSVEASTDVATFPGGPLPFWMDEPDARYWVENADGTLDQPGEWRMDQASGRVWILGDANFDPNRSEVIAPRLHSLIRVEGTRDRPVHDLALRNLVLEETDYEMPENGRISPQAAVEVRGTIQVVHSDRGEVEGCTLRNLGGYGIELGRGCRNWNISRNEIRDLGAGGIRIGETSFRGVDESAVDASTGVGEPKPFPPSPDDCHSHRILDNHLQSLGRVFAPACGILVFHSASNQIAHNHIHDLYYTGISVGWTWGYQASPCHHNRIEFNHVHDVGQGMLSDMGGIYTLGPQPGTVVRNNLFHDIQSYRYGGWGLYTDEGSTGILVENNVVYRCKDAGFHQHYGKDNVVRNNLIVDNGNHSVMRTRNESHRSFWFTRNVLVGDATRLLGSDWGGTTNQFICQSNVWWDPRPRPESDYRFSRKTWAQWRAEGQDNASLIADPLLVDPKHPEKGLRPGSPAFALGYQQIDLREVGPRPGR